MTKQTNIIATVFGGIDDPQPSAYSDEGNGWANKLGCALPYHFSGKRPQVRVYANGKIVLCEIVDVGPWNTHNNYWDTDSRPQAESGIDMSGRHTNHAGIDLTPAAAKALGIDGKGVVDWEFVSTDTQWQSGKDATMPQQKIPTKGLLEYLLDLFLLLFPTKPIPPPLPTPTPNLGPPAPFYPNWMYVAQKKIGFHELPNNQGLQELIAAAHTGSEGDPWCAIFVNACLETAGFRGSRSPSARSFEGNENFVRLDGPAYGAIVTNWRGNPSSGLGHVYFYAGEGSAGVYALGGNQSDQVKYEYEPRDKVVGYYWPKTAPLPTLGPVPVSAKPSGSGTVT